MKITVLTATYRPWNFLEEQFKALHAQTMAIEDLEWVIVDDLLPNRGYDLTSTRPLRIRHIAPKTPKDTYACSSAWNTGLIYARGELVYLMNDYVLPSKRCLERHWELYQGFGPKVILSGAIKDNGERDTAKMQPIRDGLYEITDTDLLKRWWWAGRNDSAPLEAMLDVNGWDERLDGAHGGHDVQLGIRLFRSGCRYLYDTEAPVYEETSRPGRKQDSPEAPESWEGLFYEGANGALWAPNSQNIREERACVSQ